MRSISRSARWPWTGPCGSRVTPRPEKSRRVLKLHSSTAVTETVYRHEIRPALTDNASAMNRTLKANVTELTCPCSGKAIGSPIGSRN